MAAQELASTTLASDANLVAYYKLENTSDSKGSRTFTNNNSTTFTSAMFNNGANFGSSDADKTLSYQVDSFGYAGGTFSISLWVKLNTEIASGIYDIFDLSDASTSHTQLTVNYQYNSGTPQLHFQRNITGVSTDEVVTTVTLGTSSFHNIVLAYDGSTITAYLDGVSQGTHASTATGSGGTTGFVIAGQNNSLTANNGLFIADDCALFNRNLVLADVGIIYHNPDIITANLTTGSDGSAGTSRNTASITPTANSLVVVSVIMADGGGGAGKITGISGGGITWQKWGDHQSATSTGEWMSVWYGKTASPSTGALTITTDKSVFANWSIAQFANVDQSGTNGSGAIGQIVFADASTTQTGTTVTLASLSSTANAAFGYVSWGQGATVTSGGSFAQLSAFAGTVFGYQNAEWALNQTAVNWTWASANNWSVAVAGEIFATRIAATTLTGDFKFL